MLRGCVAGVRHFMDAGSFSADVVVRSWLHSLKSESLHRTRGGSMHALAKAKVQWAKCRLQLLIRSHFQMAPMLRRIWSLTTH